MAWSLDTCDHVIMRIGGVDTYVNVVKVGVLVQSRFTKDQIALCICGEFNHSRHGPYTREFP